MREFKDAAEFLALRVIVTRILVELFRDRPGIVRPFTEGIDRTIDTFEFTDGWSNADVMNGREYMRMAADWIIRPALEDARKRRR
jgi:hypothetical protein